MNGGTSKGAARPACGQCLVAGGHGAAIASPVAIASGAMALEVAIASGAIASVAIALDGAMASPADMASGAIALEGAIASVAMALGAAIASSDDGGQAVDAMASAAYAVPAIDISNATADADRIDEIFIGGPLGCDVTELGDGDGERQSTTLNTLHENPMRREQRLDGLSPTARI